VDELVKQAIGKADKEEILLRADKERVRRKNTTKKVFNNRTD
jgi:hypothetical protein